MVDAAQIQYRQEYIAAFEMGQTLLRQCVVTETVIQGNQATFLVAGTNGGTAVTRGTNGFIPANVDDEHQYTATLAEWHDLRRKTRFNIFASQGNQRAIMQVNSVKVLNRKIDADIIAQFDTATTTTGAAATATLDMIINAQVKLGNNEVDVEDQDNIFGLISPAFRGYLMQIKEFTSVDYVDMKFLGGAVRRMTRFAGVNWITHPNLTGNATASEKCYMFHRDAIGHALDSGTLNTAIGYNDEHDYSFARSTGFFGSKLLQQPGIVQMLHDGSKYA